MEKLKNWPLLDENKNLNRTNAQLKEAIDRLYASYAEIKVQCYDTWLAWKEATDSLQQKKEIAAKLRQMLTQSANDYDYYSCPAGNSASFSESLPPPPALEHPTPTYFSTDVQNRFWIFYW